MTIGPAVGVVGKWMEKGETAFLFRWKPRAIYGRMRIGYGWQKKNQIRGK